MLFNRRLAFICVMASSTLDALKVQDFISLAILVSFLEFKMGGNNLRHSTAQKEDIDVVKAMNSSFAFWRPLF